MIDSGANISVVSHQFVKRNKLNNKMEETKQSIRVADGVKSKAKGVLK